MTTETEPAPAPETEPETQPATPEPKAEPAPKAAKAKAPKTPKPKASKQPSASKRSSAAKASEGPVVPDEWKDDIQVLPRRPGDREHELSRSCWCNPRCIGLPTIVDGSPDPVDRAYVRHRNT